MPQEATDRIQLYFETMPDWTGAGAIPAARLGNRSGFRFKREDLDRFFEGHSQVRREV